MAARFKIIILDRTPSDANEYHYLLWVDVPISRQPFYAKTPAISAWKDALPLDLLALQNGSVVETVQTQRVPAGATLAQVQAFLQQRWTDFQNDVANTNPWVRYGTTWDGATWALGGVA